MSKVKRSLTGIKPTGVLHIGNYLGSIRPAMELSEKGYESFYFIANYHALTTMHNKDELDKLTYMHVASWLAFGSQDKGINLYLQSDIPEIFELAWVLSCFTNKGLLDRAHVYKDLLAKGERSMNMGIFSYPILMAADILAFDTDYVPVGKDQKQHVEIARDIACSFNKNFGEVLKLPEPIIKEDVMTVPGIDGEKMSKSYNNIIPVFAEPDEIRKITAKIKTDSSKVEDVKDPDKCIIYNVYKLFANPEEQMQLRKKYEKGGLSWKEAKETLSSKLIDYFEPARKLYNELLQDKKTIRGILSENANKARVLAASVMERVRSAIGIS